MKLYSWNVNGLRACMNKGFADFFGSGGPGRDLLAGNENAAGAGDL